MGDADLIARLRDFATREASAMPPGWPDAHGLYSDAADIIEALVKEKAAAYAQGYGDCEAEISLTEIGRTNEFLHGQIAKWKARAERLEAALRGLVSVVTGYQNKPHPMVSAQLEASRAAITQKDRTDG